MNAFLERRLEGDWPYLWLDATYLKSRDGGHIVTKATVVAVAVHAEGQREVLGLAVGPAEREAFWSDFLRSLTRRGMRVVRLVISDAHEGLKQAAAKVLDATWQRCRVHFMRNALGHVARREQAMVAAVIRTAFAQVGPAEAHVQWRETADKLRGRYPKLGVLMDDVEDDVLAYLAFPKEHWPQLGSTNPLERLNKEIKRRSRVVGIFPNDAAIVRLVGALLMEQTDEWQVATRRYMSLETLAKVVGQGQSVEQLEEKQAA